jgi:hypothetical protein
MLGCSCRLGCDKHTTRAFLDLGNARLLPNSRPVKA